MLHCVISADWYKKKKKKYKNLNVKYDVKFCKIIKYKQKHEKKYVHVELLIPNGIIQMLHWRIIE